MVTIPITKLWVGPEEEAAVAAVLRDGWLTQGDRTFAFEHAVAQATGARYAVATNSATTALHVACILAGLGPGDEALVPSYSHVATANAVRYTGATPVFVDIRPDTYNLDEAQIEDAITPRTKAIVPVHQVGVPAEMDTIVALARARSLAVIADAACALGSRYKGRGVGQLGADFTVLSFHPRKVITTGEGGMILLEDGNAAELARSLISHGESVLDVDRHRATTVITEDFARVGFNYRLTNIQAALGLVQMDRLAEIVARRRTLAQRYSDRLREIPGVDPPAGPAHIETNYQSYLARITPAYPMGRDALMAGLRELGIASRPGIMAIHQQPVYHDHVRGSLPETDRAAQEAIILPLYPTMALEEQDAVIDAIATLRKEGRA